MKHSKYFATSDGEQFYNESDAKNHAKTLKDKTVTPPTADVAGIDTNAESVSGKEGVTLEEPFTLAAFDADAENAYEAGKALVKELKLTPPSNKKVDIFAELAAEKAKSTSTNSADPAAETK